MRPASCFAATRLPYLEFPQKSIIILNNIVP
jgi:hypothetical protein